MKAAGTVVEMAGLLVAPMAASLAVMMADHWVGLSAALMAASLVALMG